MQPAANWGIQLSTNSVEGSTLSLSKPDFFLLVGWAISCMSKQSSFHWAFTLISSQSCAHFCVLAPLWRACSLELYGSWSTSQFSIPICITFSKLPIYFSSQTFPPSTRTEMLLWLITCTDRIVRPAEPLSETSGFRAESEPKIQAYVDPNQGLTQFEPAIWVSLQKWLPKYGYPYF